MSELLVALDLDGTLEDSRADMVASVARVRANLGLSDRAPEAIVDHVNRGMAHLYLSCFDDLPGIVDEQSEAFARVADAYRTDYRAHIADSTRLYDGMDQALEALSKMAALAVVTNKPEALSVALLDALGVLGLFDAIIGGDTCAEAKPHPLPLATAADRIGVRHGPDTVVMIGDSAGDIRCGQAFGATTIWCAWGYRPLPPELRADHIAARPADLAPVVASLTRR